MFLASNTLLQVEFHLEVQCVKQMKVRPPLQVLGFSLEGSPDCRLQAGSRCSAQAMKDLRPFIERCDLSGAGGRTRTRT